MKMNKTLLRLVSVFFIVLVLAGCGMTVIFYIDSLIETKENDTKTTLLGTYKVISDNYNNLSLIEDDTGPSLWLGYVVSDASTIPASSVISKFTDTYVRKPFGRTINKVSMTDPAIITLNDASYALFQFSDANTSNDFTAPLYHATAKSHINPEDTFTITKTSIDTTNIEFALSFDANQYVIHLDAGKLRRYNGSAFRNDITYTDKDTFPDYFISETPSGNLYCHMFAAFSVTEGSFSNIYWTSLVYLGRLQLN